MALLTWNEGLSVKVSQFDREHQELVNLINKLHDAMKEGQGKQVIGSVLNGLISYTKAHFAAEERLMKAHGYPLYEKHKREHNHLTSDRAGFSEGVPGGKRAAQPDGDEFSQGLADRAHTGGGPGVWAVPERERD